jgi:hypothetical protein
MARRAWLRATGWSGVVGVVLATSASCSEDRPPPVDPLVGTGGVAGDAHPNTGGRTGGSGGATGGDAGSMGAVAGVAGNAGAAGAPPTNCGDIVCRGHGACVEAAGAPPSCACDPGYVQDQFDVYNCVVDTDCIKIRPLQDSCRTILNGPPAVGLFFAVDYCAGTAVLPADLPDLRINEDGIDVRPNVESSTTVLARGVESFVTIAIDVSASITNDPTLLSQLTARVRSFVGSLAPAVGDPPVTVSVYVFGAFVAEYVPFTTDLVAVQDALTALETDPASVQALVGGDGTALYDATKLGIQQTERIQFQREQVSLGGVLTTGTLVVITDGMDGSGATLDTGLVAATKVNLITIGISSQIDDAYLSQIGRDGSILTPSPEDWAAAFDEIAERVDQYPDRAYLLGFCSTKRTGNHVVEVTLDAPIPQVTATCTFNADTFSSSVADVCDPAFFAGECNSLDCSGLTACGGCAPGSCCASGTCVAPTPVTGSCNGQNELCPGQVCAATVCEAPLALGAPCGGALTSRCEPGVAYCSGTAGAEVCTPVTLAEGDVCGDTTNHRGDVCPTLRCAKKNPNNPLDAFVCRPPAQMFDLCAGPSASAVCGPGAYCDKPFLSTEIGVCRPRSALLCTTDERCLSGTCNVAAGLCVDTGFCPFAWDTVVPN